MLTYLVLKIFIKLIIKKFLKGFTKINLKRWMRIILTRSISIVPCVIVLLSSYKSLDSLNFWCNIIQAIQLPFALLPLLHFTSSKRIMGVFRNKLPLKIICYIVSLTILAINIFFLINLIVILIFFLIIKV
jgi:Mn2+/Fe2+ NRAMP family transporter